MGPVRLWAASERTLIATTRRLRPALVQRHAVAAYGAVADVCVQRLGATAAEAEKAEARLLNEPARWKVERMCDALEARLGLNEAELKKVVLLAPAVLGHTIEATMLPKLAALQSRLQLNEAELKKVVLGRPQVLGLSVEANVLTSLAALQSRLDLSEAELKKVVLRLPAVLGYSIEENVLPSLAALQSRVGLSEAELKRVVLGLPSVLGLSIENLLPKIDWLQRETNLSDDELRHKLVSNSVMLSYSLRDRLQPRAALCDQFGVSRSLLWTYSSRTPEAFREACEKAARRSAAV